MKKIFQNKTFTIFFLIILLQVPMSILLRNDKFKFPKGSFNEVLNGSYFLELEDFLSTNILFFNKTGAFFRKIKFEALHRYSGAIILKTDGKIFTRDKLNDIDPYETADINRAIEKVSSVQKMFEKKGVEFIPILVPSRETVYSDELYGKWGMPTRQKKVKNEFLELLSRKGVEVFDLEPYIRKWMDSYGDQLYYAGDHHWTHFASFLAAELLIDKYYDVTDKVEDLPYEPVWSIKKPKKNSLLKKMAFFREVPESLTYLYNEVTFKKKRKSNIHSDLLFVSASFGSFGIVEFLSNAKGERVAFQVDNGQGALYVLNRLVQSFVLNDKYKNVKKVFWLFPDYHIPILMNDSEIPKIYDKKDLSPVKFKVASYEGMNEFGKNKFKLTSGDAYISLDLEEKRKQQKLVIELIVSGKGKMTRLLLNKQSKIIIHDGESSFYDFKTNQKSLDFKFYSSRWSSKVNRTIKIEGVYESE